MYPPCRNIQSQTSALKNARHDSGSGLSQREATLHCNLASHWLSPDPEWSLEPPPPVPVTSGSTESKSGITHITPCWIYHPPVSKQHGYIQRRIEEIFLKRSNECMCFFKCNWQHKWHSEQICAEYKIFPSIVQWVKFVFQIHAPCGN